MTLPDVVIPVRPGDDNEELRYTLRGVAAHVPHRHVWLVGYRPSWVSDAVLHLPTRQIGSKHANARANWAAAVACPQVSDPFMAFNDDMFVMRPIDGLPVCHQGEVDVVLTRYERRWVRSSYTIGMRDTARWLRAEMGVPHPLCYEVHIPYLVDKAHRRQVVVLAEEAGLRLPHLRTIYGNLFGLGGVEIADPKIHKLDVVPDDDAVFVSTSDRSFTCGAVGEWVRARLTVPSPYELHAEAAAA